MTASITLVVPWARDHEKKRTIDLTDSKVQQELKSYIPLIRQTYGG
jgi:hypothetical protein